tara:strand:- start:4402 stop:6147 length:1746 start_codon:yes stop_codon:yes gene_type:complete
MWVFVKRYTFKYWPYYAVGFLFLIITNYISTLIPLLLKNVLDLILIPSTTFSIIRPTLLAIVFYAVILAFTRTLSRVLIFIAGRRVEFDLRNDLFNTFLTLSDRFFRGEKIGDLISRMINDMQSLRATAALGFLHIINTIMIFSFVCYQMISINLKLTLFMLIPIPLMLLVVKLFVKEFYISIKQTQEVLGDVTHFFVETLTHIKIVKSYVAESKMINIFDPLNDLFFKKSIKQARIRTAIFPFIAIGGSLGQIFLLLIGGQLIIEEKLSIGDFVAMSSYVALLAWPTASLAWIINIIQRGKSSWARISKIFNEKVDFPIESSNGSSQLTSQIIPSVKLNNLSFSYSKNGNSTDKVLENISFKIKAGSVLGVFGPSGSGKTTLARILAGTELLDNDKYFINGHCFNTWDVKDFRSQISYVQQEPFLFSVPVSENVDFQETDHDHEKIKAMTDLAVVSADIETFTEQYDTLIGERGVVLSGGQKTRLALSRALFKPHSFLILDDVLSAVDHETEQQLIANLQKDKDVRTTIIISHRISALTHCDHIIVLDKGRIIDQGNHNELIKKDGLYKFSWQYQKMTNE